MQMGVQHIGNSVLSQSVIEYKLGAHRFRTGSSAIEEARIQTVGQLLFKVAHPSSRPR